MDDRDLTAGDAHDATHGRDARTIPDEPGAAPPPAAAAAALSAVHHDAAAPAHETPGALVEREYETQRRRSLYEAFVEGGRHAPMWHHTEAVGTIVAIAGPDAVMHVGRHAFVTLAGFAERIAAIGLDAGDIVAVSSVGAVSHGGHDARSRGGRESLGR